MTTRLPIAAATQFCTEAISLRNGLTFFVDGNSKITLANGTYAEPAPNAFSLPAASVSGLNVGHCPGSTTICRDTCYVKGLARRAPSVYAGYERNAQVLDSLLGDRVEAMHAAEALAEWIRAYAPHGFRWHVSGDVWHRAHARWIVSVCQAAPAVPFWIYTRTLGAVSTLTHAENLAVNVSTDTANYSSASSVARLNGCRTCHMATGDGAVPGDLSPGDVIFPDYALRGRDLEEPSDAPWWQGLTHEQRAMVCPADFFGQSEQHRCGPCRKCLT